jgi:hypothetical protein
VDQFILLRRPICCCEILPNGAPGLASINGGEYRIACNAELPEVGEPIVYGYRLTSPAGDVYDVPADLSSCDCMGSERWRAQFGADVCKHVRALAQFFGAR